MVLEVVFPIVLHRGCWLSANKSSLFLLHINNDSVGGVFVLAEFNIFMEYYFVESDNILFIKY